MPHNSSNGPLNNASDPSSRRISQEAARQNHCQDDLPGSPPVEKVSITRARYRLKVRLYAARTLPGERGPRCAMCCEARPDLDMHEVLIPRRAIQKMAPERRVLAYCAPNCVLVCQACHPRADTAGGIARCVRHLLAWEGHQAIHHWLESLMPVFRGDAVRLAANRLEEELRAVLALTAPRTRSWILEAN